MYARTITPILTNKFFKKKAIVILGARQTGKTTLTKLLTQEREERILQLNADELIVREQLQNASLASLKQIIGNNNIVIIDEAQRILNIGITLKLIIDNLPNIQLIITGSSALDLASEINEPLTGRIWQYNLYPISWEEFRSEHHFLEAKSMLEQRLIFGMYPDVINNTGNEKEVLNLLANSYLYKDLLNFKGIRKPELLEQLLKALALQMGNEVSYNELSKLLKVDKLTISNYIELLEKSFIVFRLSSYSSNVRNEIAKGKKIYFYDNGIRNSIIQNYNPLNMRNDTGALWENFLISERIKINHYHQHLIKHYFWRNTNQQEIDYIEESAGELSAFEFKWNSKVKNKIPSSFTNAYKVKQTLIINQDNYEDFIMEPKV
jgi:predicted AAA+ superfamily ATPase